MTKSLTLSSGRVLVLHKFFWAITRGMAGYAMSCTPFAFSFLLVNGEDKYIAKTPTVRFEYFQLGCRGT